MTTWVWPVPGIVPWEIHARETVNGSFAFERKHDFHTGVDIYAPEGQPVHAVEAGIVVTIDDFTGTKAESPWWEDTRAIFIEGEAGVVGYGEVLEVEGLKVGDAIEASQLIGHVKRVLKMEKKHPNPKAMLHIELYQESYRGEGDWWKLSDPMPPMLLDPTKLLRGAWARVTERDHRDLQPIPTDLVGRKELIGSAIEHRLFTYPFPFGDETEEQARAEEYWGGGSFDECVDIEHQYVDPTTESLRGGLGSWDDPRNNTPRVWIEGGGWSDESESDSGSPTPSGGWNQYNKWMRVHDYNLNTGGYTLEEAFLNFARLVKFYYNDDGTSREDAPEQCEGDFTLPNQCGYKSGCTDAGDGFCEICGFLMKPHEDDEKDKED